MSEDVEVNTAENFVRIDAPQMGKTYSAVTVFHDYNTVRVVYTLGLGVAWIAQTHILLASSTFEHKIPECLFQFTI